MQSKFRLLVLFLLGIILHIPLWGQDAELLPELEDSVVPPRHLIIGAKESPPFLFLEDGEWRGISLELWKVIAEELNITYEFKKEPFQKILADLKAGNIDLCINPLTVTSERIEDFDFTQPFYASNSSVVAKVKPAKGALDFILQFFSYTFLKVILLLFTVLLIFGFLVWFFERKANPEEFSNNIKGLWSGLWWSAVTMTTVGYGDKSPRSFGGRLIALVWMFTAVIIISSFTASISSALTVDQLDNEIQVLEDLRKRKIGTVKASASASFLKNNYFHYVPYKDIEDGLHFLENGTLDAFIYDEPILRYYLDSKGLNALQILPLRFNPQYYSFSLPKNSPLREEIDPVLLGTIEEVSWKVTLTEYGLGDL